MTDRLAAAFDALLARMEEPPSWDEVSTIEAGAVVAPRGQGPAWAIASGVVTLLVIGVAAVFLATGEPAATTAPAVGVECQTPPLAERELASPAQVSIEPNPVAADATVTLSVSGEGLLPEYGAATYASWQCWDGTEWVDTHIAFIIGPAGQPETIQSLPGVTVTFAAALLVLPLETPIVVPALPPGTYRIRIGLTASATENLDAFVVVDVVDTTTFGSTSTTIASTTTVVSDPEVTTPDAPSAAVIWELDDVGMDAAYVASSGRIVVANEDVVFIANGFSSDASRRISAVSADSGAIIWQRDDIVADDSFLQAVAGDLLFVNGQFDTIVAVSVATGESVWSFQLPERYGLVSSVVDGDQIIIAAEAPMEGDTRAPLIFALDLQDGSERWSTSLGEGTDLQWESPPVADGLVLVAATPSHPGVGGNTLDTLDTSTGEVKWVFDAGGEQGFHTYPVLVDGDVVALWSPEDVLIGLDVTTGGELWRLPGSQPLLNGPDGSIYTTGSGGLQRVDIGSGTATVVSESVAGFPISSAISVDDRQLVVAGRLGMRGIDTETGEVLWHWSEKHLVDGRIVTAGGLIIAPTSDGGVVAVRIPAP